MQLQTVLTSCLQKRDITNNFKTTLILLIHRTRTRWNNLHISSSSFFSALYKSLLKYQGSLLKMRNIKRWGISRTILAHAQHVLILVCFLSIAWRHCTKIILTGINVAFWNIEICLFTGFLIFFMMLINFLILLCLF